MSRVILDAELRARLLNLTQPIDLCDESGKVVGRFIPLNPASRYDEPPLSEEEWRRRELEPDYSTAEVIARLEEL